MTAFDAQAPRLIALDWGTSSLRAMLLGPGGTVLDRRSAALGIMQVGAGGFSAAFAEVAGEWRAAAPDLPAVAAGMVGSAQGWREAPYVIGSAGPEELANGLVAVESGSGAPVHIVPGVAVDGPPPDVMRGEETQILGALAIRPELAENARLVLPGTHSKWASLSGGRIAGFRTFMTGELFAVLRAHSILGRPARDARASPGGDDAAFALGVATARECRDGIAPLLFSARSRVLRAGLPAASSLDYLSGLLIGDEVRCAAPEGPETLAMIGDAALCNRYRQALALFGRPDIPSIEHATETGLWRIACAAGLAQEEATP